MDKHQIVAQAICRAVTGDCVMDEEPARPLCTEENCVMVRVAERAIGFGRESLHPRLRPEMDRIK